MAKAKRELRYIEISSTPKGAKKVLGGADRDEWNDRLSDLVACALPVNQTDVGASNLATAGAFAGMMDMKPTDPIEGMLIGQMIVASEAALSMYRLAWQQPSEYFIARTKYLQLADKATRTVAMLSERLDQHRGRGQQQIVVKHVTVNADQAVVADQIVTRETAGAMTAKALPPVADEPMRTISSTSAEAVPAGGGAKPK
jgi:hypothetical protein